MNTDDFETRLSRQPLRPPPPQWRGEILTACGVPVSRQARVQSGGEAGAGRSGDRRSVPWWLAWLMPGRAEYAALGAAWCLIGLLWLSNPDEPAAQAPDIAVATEALDERRRLMAELVGAPEPRERTDAVTRPRGDFRREPDLVAV